MCQSAHLYEMALKDPFVLRFEKFVRSVHRQLETILSAAKAEMERHKTQRAFSREKGARGSTRRPSLALKPGDIVRVHSKEGIRRALDDEDKLDGCLFMNEMLDYCGTQQEVLKRVEYFYDEGTSEMRRMRNTVLLEGLHCSGSLIWKQKCDKHCLFFWKEDWLEKVE